MPPVVTTACENPDGRGSDGGFTRSSAICSPPVSSSASPGRHRACLVPGSPSLISCSLGRGPSVRPVCGGLLPAFHGSGHAAAGPS